MFDNYDEILSVEDVCQMLYIGRNGLYRILASGDIKAFQYGRTWKIPRKAILDYIIKKSGVSYGR